MPNSVPTPAPDRQFAVLPPTNHHGRRRPLAERRHDILDALEDGWRPPEIADRLGFEVSWLYAYLRSIGAAPEQRRVADHRREILRAAAAGESVASIAGRLQFHIDSIYRLLAKAGRRKGRPARAYSAALAREAVRLYVEERLGAPEIRRRLAGRCGGRPPGKTWICQQVRRLGYQTRGYAESRQLAVWRRRGGDPRSVRLRAMELRLVERRTLREIGAELGVTQQAVSLWLRAEHLCGRLPKVGKRGKSTATSKQRRLRRSEQEAA